MHVTLHKMRQLDCPVHHGCRTINNGCRKMKQGRPHPLGDACAADILMNGIKIYILALQALDRLDHQEETGQQLKL